MKKILAFFVAFLLMGICAYAYEGYGTCKIPNTNDYLEGTAYLDITSRGVISGNLVITNASSRPLQSASITVTVDCEWKEKHHEDYKGMVEKSYSKRITLYNSRWTGTIAGHQSGTIDLSGSIQTFDAYGCVITSVNVSISNPYCN